MTILKRWKQIKYLGKNKPPTGSQGRLQREAWLLVITRWTRVQVGTLDTREQGHTGRQTHVNSGTQEDNICMKTDTRALRHAWRRTLTKTDTCEDRYVSCPCSIKFSDSNILHKPHSFPGLTFVSSWEASFLRGTLTGRVLVSDIAWAAHLGAQTSAGLLLPALQGTCTSCPFSSWRPKMTMISVHPRAFHIPFHVGERCSAVFKKSDIKILNGHGLGHQPTRPGVHSGRTSSDQLEKAGPARHCGLPPKPTDCLCSSLITTQLADLQTL